VELKPQSLCFVLVKQTDNFNFEDYCSLECYTVPFGGLVQTFRMNLQPCRYITYKKAVTTTAIPSVRLHLACVQKTNDLGVSSSSCRTDKTGYAIRVPVAEGDSLESLCLLLKRDLADRCNRL
jgi:hypothetical protein